MIDPCHNLRAFVLIAMQHQRSPHDACPPVTSFSPRELHRSLFGLIVSWYRTSEAFYALLGKWMFSSIRRAAEWVGRPSQVAQLCSLWSRLSRRPLAAPSASPATRPACSLPRPPAGPSKLMEERSAMNREPELAHQLKQVRSSAFSTRGRRTGARPSRASWRTPSSWLCSSATMWPRKRRRSSVCACVARSSAPPRRLSNSISSACRISAERWRTTWPPGAICTMMIQCCPPGPAARARAT